jgi:hypothetical protein
VHDSSANVLQRVEYTYYDDVTSPSSDIGVTGELVQVKISKRATTDRGSTVSIVRYTQYRYSSSVKAVYEHDASVYIFINRNGGLDASRPDLPFGLHRRNGP